MQELDTMQPTMMHNLACLKLSSMTFATCSRILGITGGCNKKMKIKKRKTMIPSLKTIRIQR